MKWARVETRYFQASERFINPNSLTIESKIERSQSIARYRLKSWDKKGFDKRNIYNGTTRKMLCYNQKHGKYAV
jgi:hypothetical protein